MATIHVPTVVVHGGAGTYLSIMRGWESKEGVENGACFDLFLSLTFTRGLH